MQHRRQGVNRYEICQLLAPKLKHLTPSPSTVYRIAQRSGLNRLTPPLKQEKRRIIKRKAGELGHLDCHHLSKDLIGTDPTRYYLVCVIDACTRPLDSLNSQTKCNTLLRCCHGTSLYTTHP